MDLKGWASVLHSDCIKEYRGQTVCLKGNCSFKSTVMCRKKRELTYMHRIEKSEGSLFLHLNCPIIVCCQTPLYTETAMWIIRKKEHAKDKWAKEHENMKNKTRDIQREQSATKPILFDLNLTISATPRAHRTSDQTERVLQHTAPIVLSPPSEIPPLPLWNEKNKHIILNAIPRPVFFHG